jgi:hypothetical protein
MVRSKFDPSLWIILVFDGVARPHSFRTKIKGMFETSRYVMILTIQCLSRNSFLPFYTAPDLGLATGGLDARTSEVINRPKPH